MNSMVTGKELEERSKDVSSDCDATIGLDLQQCGYDPPNTKVRSLNDTQIEPLLTGNSHLLVLRGLKRRGMRLLLG